MLSLLCADIPIAGRVSKDMLSDQQRIEIFFSPDNFADARALLKGDEDDACSWSGVHCPEGGSTIDEISWHGSWFVLEGSIDFHSFPSQLRIINTYDQRLRGEIDTTALPDTLEVLCLQHCDFTGVADLGSLPPKLDELFLTKNRITAVVNFCNVPESLRCFEIKEPNVKGLRIHVGALPQNTHGFDLKVGSIDEVTYENPEEAWRVVLKSYEQK